MTKKTIANDLSKITGTNNTFFSGGVEDQINLYQDRFTSGFAFIYWVDLPFWFEQDEDLKYYKQLSQLNFRAFNGVTSIDLDTASIITGFAGHETNTVTGINRNNTDFSITHAEYSGGVMRKMYQKWITMIRDPRTGTALYPRLYGCDYGARNHTGQLLYVMTRPDVTNTQKNIVEYACLYTNVFPTNVPLDSLYNFSLGDQDVPTIDITFKGFPEIGPDVDRFALKILREKIMNFEPDGEGQDWQDTLDTVEKADTNWQGVAKELWGENIENIEG